VQSCIVMHCIGWSRIYWRPSLFFILCHRQGQITNTNKFTSIIQTFLYHEVSHREVYKDSFMPVLQSFVQGADGVHDC
jgi:hypothetical protein